MADPTLPTLNDTLAGVAQRRLARSVRAAEEREIANRPSILGGGIRAGFNELQGLGGFALAGAGTLAGSDRLQNYGFDVAEKNLAEAQQFGRPDLETAPWKEGGASALPWLGYQISKQIPNLVGAGVGGAVGKGIAGAALKGSIAKAGAAGLAKQQAAQRVGSAAGMGAFGTTVGFGSMFGSAKERADAGGGDVTRDDALKSLALAPVYGVAEVALPAFLGKVATGTGFGSLSARTALGRTAQAATAGFVTEGATEAFQTGLEQTFRSDLSWSDKVTNVIDAAITGGAVGGGLGGGTSGVVEGVKKLSGTSDTKTVADVVDEALASDQGAQGAQQAEPPLALPAPPRQLPAPQTPAQVQAKVQSDAVAAAEPRILSGAATPQDLAVLDAAVQQDARLAAASVEQGGTPKPTDLMLRAKLVTDQAIQKTQENLGKLVGKPNQLTKSIQARTMAEAGVQILEQLEQGVENTRLLNLAEKMGIIDSEGRTLDQRDIPAERAAIEARIETETRSAAVAPTPEQGKAAKKRATEAQRELTQLEAAVMLRERIEEQRTADPDALASAVLDKRPPASAVAPTPVDSVAQEGLPTDAPVQAGAPVAPPASPFLPREGVSPGINPDTITTESYQNPTSEAPLPMSAGPEASAPSALAEQLAPIAAQLDTSRNRDAEFDAATAQADQQRAAQGPERVEAEAEWNRRAGDGNTLYEQLTPAAQQEWAQAVAGGAANKQTFERIRRSRRRVPATQELQGNEITVLEDRTKEPTIKRRAKDASGNYDYDVTLPSGRQATMTYVRAGKNRGWYVKGSEGTAEGFIIQKGGAQAAAVALRDRAADAPLPAGASLNPNTGTRFSVSGRVVENPVSATDVSEDITRVYGARSDVSVVETLADLPQDVKDGLDAGTPPQGIQGMVAPDGRVFLIAENISSRQEAVAVANHEILGHKGLDKLFRQRLDAALMDMYNTNPGVNAKTELWLSRNPEVYTTDRNRTARAVEEVLARMSESGVIEVSTWDKLVRVVKDMLRRAGVKMTMTDREISATLARAHELATGAAKTSKSGGFRYMYAGMQAIGINKKLAREQQRVDSMLREARAMARRGRQDEDIRLATGWHRSETDGKWRYEIADRNAKLLNETPQSPDSTPKALNQVLEHPRLFEFYPELATVDVVYSDLPSGGGSFMEGIRRITLSTNSDPNEQRLTLLHEVQHAIQAIEGFARGTTAKPEGMRQLSLTNLKRVVPKFHRVEQTANQRFRDARDIVAAIKDTPEAKDLLAQIIRTADDSSEVDLGWLDMVLDARERVESAGLTFEPRAWDAVWDKVHDAKNVQDLTDIISGEITKSDATLVTIASLDKALADQQFDKVRPLTTRLSKEPRMAKAAYYSSAGELESTDVEARADYTDEQLRGTSPLVDAREKRGIRVGEESLEGRGNAPVERMATADVNKAMDQAVGFATKLKEAARKLPKTVGPNLRKLGLYLADIKHIERYWGSIFPTDPVTGTNAVERLVDSFRTRSTTAARMSTMMLAPYHAFEQLDKADQAIVGDLMSKTQYGIDPRKPPRSQPWLQNIKNKADREFVIAEARKAHQVYTRLKKRGKAGVYNDLVAANEAQIAAQNSMAMYNTLRLHPDVADALLKEMNRSPMERFVQSKAQLHLDTQQARDFWVNEQETMLKKVEQWTEAKRNGSMSTLTATEAQNEIDKLAPIEQSLRDVRRNKEDVVAPYFHLGRFGNYFVSFNVKADPDSTKTFDRQSLKALTDLLEKKGFDDIRITAPIDGRNVFIRLESEAQTADLYAALDELQASGAIEKLKNGDRRKGTDQSSIEMEQWANDLVSFVNSRFKDTEGMGPKEAATFRATGKQFESLIRDHTLNKLPDTSNTKVMLHRRNVAGFSPDMVRSYAFRSEIAAKSLANISAAPAVTEAFTSMKAAVKKSQETGGDKVFKQQDVLNELAIREADRGVTEEYSPWDSVRAANHVYFLGLSPAYFITNVTQVWALLLPELGKKHGFMKSMNAVNRNTGRAFKILQASLAEAKASGGGARAMVDLQITAESLVRAGLEQKEADFFMRVLNMGTIDIGSASREIGRISEGSNNSRLDMAFRAGSVMGLYSEVVTRTAAALAVYELADAKEKSSEAGLYALSRKASATIDETMLNYSPWAIGRFSGKKGQAGALTPVLLSFMQYTFQLTTKLYRETYNTFGGETADAKREARRFLAGHAAMITTLAGSLGLPAATVFAEVFNNIGDLFDEDEEQPTDVVTAYRNFLADTFGAPLGEVMARGVPRALGFDLSRRAGEQDIIPFSRLIADSRKFDESFKEAGARALGSPYSALTNIFAGAEQMANGEFLKGMETAIPIAGKGVLKGYSLSRNGYRDTAGNTLPMSAGAMDVLYQVLGFSSSEKAEYSEAKFANTRRVAQLARRAQDIRKNLAVAIENNDRAAAQEWITAARAFDTQNPAFDILPGLGRTISQRTRARALGSATGTPIGTDIKDSTAMQLGRFGNF